MGGTPLFGGSWGPILQLDLENWIVFLEVLDLTCNILDLVHELYFPGDPLKHLIIKWLCLKGLFMKGYGYEIKTTKT